MDGRGEPNAANCTSRPRRRNQRRGRLAASSRRHPPATDVGADPDAGAGSAPRESMRDWPTPDELMSRCLGEEPFRIPRHLLIPREFITSPSELERASELPRHPSPATRLQASSSTAPPSGHPEAGRTGSGTLVRQSVLYSDRPRQAQRRRPQEHVDHPKEVSSSELEVTNPPIFEALSASGSAGFHSDHPGAERAVTRTRVRQSVLYSNRPRRLQPQLRQAPLPTEEHPGEVTISELDGAVTDSPTLEPLSLSDPSLLTPNITGEETDEDDESSHLCGHGDVGYSIGPIGLTESMLLSLGDSLLTTVPFEEMRKPYSDEDPEKLRCEIKEYFDKHPRVSLEEAFDRLLAVEYAELTALAAEKGTEPPRNPFLVDQEAPSLQAQQEDSKAISHEASTGVINDGMQWIRDEVTLCFRKHVQKTPYLDGCVFELDELCHQCFNVENYKKIFHHYNFIIRMKMPASVEWTKELYFGEVKEIFGRKFYFCCPLEPNESGHCYACKNQGMEDLRHPVTGGFEIGLPDTPTPNFYYSYDE